MCQGNVEVTAAHPFVLCDSHIDYFFLCLSKVMDRMYNIVNDPEIFILETA